MESETNIITQLLMPYISPDRLCKKYENIKASRNVWEEKWQAIQDQVFPDYRDYQNTYKLSNPDTGKIKNHSSAVSGKINKVVAMISSQLCDPSVKWLDLKFGIDAMNQNYPTAFWLWNCTETLYQVFADPETEFYSSTYSFHFDWFTLGTACREVSLRKDNGKLKFSTVSMQDIFVETNGYGDIETVFRRLMLTAKQAVSIFGQNVHPKILQQAEKEEISPTEMKHEFFEVVMPNPLRNSLPTLAYVSCVIDKSNKSLVDIGLHSYSPYIVSRFFVAPGETYGRSFVWTAMPDIVAINQISKRLLHNIDFATMPIILTQDESLPAREFTPGSFIQGLDVNGRPTFQQLQLGGNLPMGMELFAAKLNDLDEALVAREIFPMDAPNMTATEVNERKLQANNRLRPLLVRLEGEDLNRTVLRVLKLLEQTGQLPPFPYTELGIPQESLPDPISMLRVRFSGQMAKMQKLQDIINSDMLFQKALQAAQVDPTVLDRINLDQLVALDADIYGVPKKIINPEEVVQQIREARQKQQEEEAQRAAEDQMLNNLLKLRQAGLYEQAI